MSPQVVLIVEDEEMQRRQLARALRAWGYTVTEAASGKQAVKKLAEQDFNLVLTDRRMPGLNGEALLNHIRTHYATIPVAIITAYPDGMEELKPDALLVKPFTGDQLRTTVTNLTVR